MSFSAASLASLPPERRAALVATLSPAEAERLVYDWRFWARPKQVEPEGDWRVWLISAGRMFGKTRTGAEWVRERVEAGARRIVLIGRTVDDVRDTMIRGESGILAISPTWNRPAYVPSLRRLTWPNGAEALTYTAEKPDQMRGPNPDTAWCDELAAWQYPDMWDQVQFALRSIQSGLRPRICVTTTPRPTPLVRAILADPATVVTHGSTTENIANVDPATVAYLRRKYGGTRLGRQELEAEILDDAPGALWKRGRIDELRVSGAPELRRVIVAVDPAVSAQEGSDETGIVTVGLGIDGHGYVLGDLSGVRTPAEWGAAAVRECKARGANRIIAEANQGGNLVEANIKAAAESLNVRGVVVTLVHASRGKQARAEPISALYEQGRVHHVGSLAALEDQLCQWVPGASDSPDRLDALVYGLTDLMVDGDPRATAPRAVPIKTHFAPGQKLGPKFQW
jgi:phage terminase large subunit-like protein